MVDVMTPALLQRRGAAAVSAAEGVGVGSLGDGRGVLFPFRGTADQGCEPVKTDTKQNTLAQSARASNYWLLTMLGLGCVDLVRQLRLPLLCG